MAETFSVFTDLDFEVSDEGRKWFVTVRIYERDDKIEIDGETYEQCWRVREERVPVEQDLQDMLNEEIRWQQIMSGST